MAKRGRPKTVAPKPKISEPAVDSAPQPIPYKNPLREEEVRKEDRGVPFDAEHVVSSAQTIADEIEEAISKPFVEEEVEETPSEEQESQTAEDDEDEEEALADALEDFLPHVEDEPVASEQEKTDDVSKRAEKRIEKLLARERAALNLVNEEKEKRIRLEERVKIIEEGKTAASKEDDTISEEDLGKALAESIEENDHQGVMDILNYKLEQAKKDLRSEYTQEQSRAANIVKAKKAEWGGIVEEYSSDSYENPIFKRDKDFDISDGTSALYVLAEKTFRGNERYKVNGGMRAAVQDAFVSLVKSKLGKLRKKTKETETEGLTNRLEKEKRKNSPIGGLSADEETPTRLKSPKSVLDEFVGEKRKQQDDRNLTGVK